jgi:hypothetical protein
VTITRDFDRRIWEYIGKNDIPARTTFLDLAELTPREKRLYKDAIDRLSEARCVSLPRTVFNKIINRLTKPPITVPKDPRGGQERYQQKRLSVATL